MGARVRQHALEDRCIEVYKGARQFINILQWWNPVCCNSSSFWHQIVAVSNILFELIQHSIIQSQKVEKSGIWSRLTNREVLSQVRNFTKTWEWKRFPLIPRNFGNFYVQKGRKNLLCVYSIENCVLLSISKGVYCIQLGGNYDGFVLISFCSMAWFEIYYSSFSEQRTASSEKNGNFT